MIVGVLSDTHGMLVPVAYNAVADCDAIIHAGDIGNPGILDELATLKVPLYAVYGNNDYPADYGERAPFRQQFRLDGVTFLVSHYPRDINVRSLSSQGVLKPGDPIPRICIHGHTHCPKLLVGKDASPVDIVLCPGSVSRPRSEYSKSVARIELEAGKIVSAAIVTLEGDIVCQWPR